MSKTTKPVSLAPVKALSQPQPTPASAAAEAKVEPATVEPVTVTTPKPTVVAAAAPAKGVKPVAKSVAKSVAKPAAKTGTMSAAKTAAASEPTSESGTPAVAAEGAKADTVKSAAAKPPAAKAGATRPASAKSTATKSPAPKAPPKAPAVEPAAAKREAEPAATAAASTRETFGQFLKPMGPNRSETLAGFDIATAAEPVMASWAEHMIHATRALGAIQATLIDHAVGELKAGLADIEACARSAAPSEVVMIQARAFRRSADALANTAKTVAGAMGAGKSGPAA